MKLWDLIKPNKKDVFQEYTDNMPPLQPIQVVEADNGQMIATPVQAAPQRKGLTLSERLFGVSATPTDNIDTNAMNATISQNPRVGGLLNDIAAGAKENYATGFAAPNLYEKETPDGRDKGFAYRLGEGLGSVGRVLQSPLGRGLITAGIVGATGGGALPVLAYGGMSGMLNQQNRMKDEMYRKHLIQEGIDPSNIRGYIGDDTFKQLLNAQTLQDNAAFRRMYYDNQQKQNEIMNQFRQDQAEYQRQKDAADRQDRALTRALTARGQDLSYSGTMARINADEKKAANKQSAKMQDAQSTLKQISSIRDMVRKNPNATGLTKGMLTGDLLNRLDSKKSNIETRSAIDALRTKIRHDLTGAQFSPKEAREYEKFLPNVRDNAQIINAKLDALEKRYMADFGVSLTGGDNNPLGLNL